MEHVRELLRQVWEGADFDGPEKLLRSVSAKAATTIVPGAPYSIATNVAHAEIWQRLWLSRLEGKPKFNPFPDFPVPAAKEWEKVRGDFLEGFARAVEIANADPFEHHAKDDISASRILMKIAVHNAYHIGQVALLKRLLRAQSRLDKA